MSGYDELKECAGTDEVALRLIGIIERLLDENAALRAKQTVTVPFTTQPYTIDPTPKKTWDYTTYPNWNHGPVTCSGVTCSNGGDSE